MKIFRVTLLWILALFPSLWLNAQCSICTKTAQQLGDGPAAGMNTGIIYLGLVPLAIFGYFGYRWWQYEKLQRDQ